MGEAKVTVKDMTACKGGRKVTMLTAYDYPMASLVDKAGIDMVLVGDSLANVVLGLESTTQVGMQEMLYHSRAVSRAVKRALIIGDMPYESYQAGPGGSAVTPEDAAKNALRFIKEAGCDAVKLEWFDRCLEATERIVKAGIAVVGHIGLTPQTADKLGGFKVQGRDAEAAERLIQQALALQEKGCFAIVLECVPDKIARLITERLRILTIGIGAGPFCDGQVLVIHDALGLFERYKPKFVKQYINLSPLIQRALEDYRREVEEGSFPAPEHTFAIKDEEFRKIKQ